MKLSLAILLAAAAANASAQDSSFARLQVRGSIVRNPVSGHIADDWDSRTGGQLDVGLNVGRGEVAATAAHLGFRPTTGKPPFTGTFVSLSWTTRLISAGRLRVEGGPRLTDLRMDFDDPSLVVGLRTEEEVMLGAVARAIVPVRGRYTAFVEGSYGALMLSTRTSMLFVSAGIGASFSTPGWVRGILR
jgi:hypothetical protein